MTHISPQRTSGSRPTNQPPAFEAAHARANASEPRLLVRDVEKRFGSTIALAATSLSIADGEFVCLVGPSGCGKSTLLRIVAGLTTPTRGEIRIEHGSSPGHSSIGLVAQDYGVFPWKTVLDNVALGLRLSGTPRSAAREVAREWLGRLGLEGFDRAYPHQLSGGMKQRVAIGRAFAAAPELLLMDEPFAALDAQRRLVLQEVLLNLWESQRRTVVFVTHSIDEAVLLGDRVIVMSSRPGRIIADIAIELPRPRPPEVRGSARFAHYHEQIWALLRDEVLRVDEVAR